MSDDVNIKIQTILEADEAASVSKIKGQLPSIENALKSRPIKVPVEADARETARSVQDSVKKATGSLKIGGAPVTVPIKIKADINYLRKSLELDFRRFKAQSRDLNIDTSGFTSAFDTGAYKNASKELINLFKELRAISAEGTVQLPDLAISNFSKNIKSSVSQMDALEARFKALSKGTPTDITSKISGLRAELEKLSAIPQGAATDADVNKFRELSVGIDDLKNSLKSLVAEDKKFKIDIGAKKLQTDIQVVRQNLLNMKQDYSKAFTNPKFASAWQKLFDATGAVKTRAELTALTSQVRLFDKEIQGAGMNMKTFLGRVGDNFKKFISWFAIGGVTATIARSMREVVSSVVELNKAFVDIQMVTNGTNAETEKLMKSYSSLAKRIGATTTEVASAASDWLRQGFSTKDTETLIENSMVLSKVGAIDAAAATNYLTTAMKGYGLAVADTLGVVDKLSAVDLVSATSAGGLAEGMSEVANNARLAGVEMDKLLGYLAVIGETTGAAPSSVGTTLNAIFSRMGNVKLSRLKDYQNETGEDLSNVETVLRGEGIALRDSANSFRNFGDVLDETASKWDSFSDVSKRAIASAFGGIRQIEETLVLMENYGKATEYAAVASESSGTAMEKMGAYQEGIEARQKRMTAASQEFSNAILGSDLIKFTYDAGTGILGFLTKITETLGALPVLASTAAAALSFKNVG